MSLLQCITLDTGPNPTSSIIWMHGLGADGNDFAPIASQLDLTGCPPIRFIFPHAPVMPVTLNGGYQMRAWYDLYGMDLLKREDEAGIRTSQARIEALIAQEIARGVPSNRIVLAGFSQGCAIALHTGLRHSEPLAGIMCLSGYLPLSTKAGAECHPANQTTPIFMAHGEYDHVIPIQRALESRAILVGLHHKVEWHPYPMEHSVSEDEINDIGAWLRVTLPFKKL
jgi:phospholipase/carboxylesterase